MTSRRFILPLRAFTLVEILVVVAVVALLMAILLPSLAQARAQARSTQCLGQVRQAVIAINEYSVEWKGVFPRGASPNDVHWTRLIGRIFGEKSDYKNINQLDVRKFEPFHCPQRTALLPFPFVDYVINALPADGPIQGYWEEAKYSRVEDYKRPSNLIYMLDAEREDRNIGGAGTVQPPVSLKEARINWWVNWENGTWRTNPDDPSNPPAIDSMDIWLGEHVPQGFAGINTSDGPGPRRAARKMHLNRWTNGGFLDGHAAGVGLENRGYTNRSNGNYAVWLRRFGIKEERIANAARVLR